MGQKVHPIGFRLGIIKGWESNWFSGKDLKDKLLEDYKIRQYIRKRFPKAVISRIYIERIGNSRVEIVIYTSRPGFIIGKGGQEVKLLREELRRIINKNVEALNQLKNAGEGRSEVEVQVFVEEIKNPYLDAQVVAQEIARQLEARASFRRVMKKALAEVVRAGAKGVKIKCSGRLGGVEMARSEEYREGRIPLSTIRADIDYAFVPAYTIYGVIGVKVWIFRKELYGKIDIFADAFRHQERKQAKKQKRQRSRNRGGKRNYKR